jgi:assimilatory nitrate reductase catalytic subunit
LFGTDVGLLAYHDTAAGSRRFAAFAGRRLIGALFVAPDPVAVSRPWLAEQLEADFSAPADRLRLLAGRAGAGKAERGAIVCACFDVGVNQIVQAASAGGCRTVEAIGAATQAGTNCGSCRGEIQRLIDATGIQKAG